MRILSITLLLVALLPTARAVAVRGESGISMPGTLLDAVIAVIEGEPVLLSDVMMEHDLGLLEPVDGEGEVDALLVPYLNRLAIIREAEEIGSFSLASGQIKGAYGGYLSRFESDEAFKAKLQQWGIDEQEVIRRLIRALTVSLYTESRIQFFIGVLPSEIEETYQKDPQRWGDRELFEVWNEIRDSLQEEAFARERKRWLDTLWKRYRVQMLDFRLGEKS